MLEMRTVFAIASSLGQAPLGVYARISPIGLNHKIHYRAVRIWIINKNPKTNKVPCYHYFSAFQLGSLLLTRVRSSIIEIDTRQKDWNRMQTYSTKASCILPSIKMAVKTLGNEGRQEWVRMSESLLRSSECTGTLRWRLFLNVNRNDKKTHSSRYLIQHNHYTVCNSTFCYILGELINKLIHTYYY